MRTPQDGAALRSDQIILPWYGPLAIAECSDGPPHPNVVGLEDKELDPFRHGACCSDVDVLLRLSDFFSLQVSFPVSHTANGFTLRTSHTATVPSWLATANFDPSVFQAVEKHELVGPPPWEVSVHDPLTNA